MQSDVCCKKSKLGDTYIIRFPRYTNDLQKSIAWAGDNSIYFHRPLADEAEAARAFIKRSSAVTLKLLAE